MGQAVKRPQIFRGLWLGLWLALAGAMALADGKGDIVEFGNGSRLVGDIKYLERGKLYFKTDTTDTIALDWADITRLVTTRNLRVLQRDGDQYFGSLRDPGPQTGALLLAGAGDPRLVQFQQVVHLAPIEDTAWERTDIDVSTGYAYTRSTEVRQWHLGLQIENETATTTRNLRLGTQSSGSSGEDDAFRGVLTYQAFNFRDNNWGSGWIAGGERNDALNLDLRASLGYAMGPRYYPSPQQRVLLFGGLQVSQEESSNGESTSSLESVFAASFDWFRFRSPELDLATSLVLFPGLTEYGRVRGTLETSLRWEIFEDFFWELSLYNDYDNQAGESGNSSSSNKNDYGISTGIGWSH